LPVGIQRRMEITNIQDLTIGNSFAALFDERFPKKLFYWLFKILFRLKISLSEQPEYSLRFEYGIWIYLIRPDMYISIGQTV
jgi:hypothetical protein